MATRDAEGEPVGAEVSVAVTDESVSAIREEIAGDPRPFFYGEVRSGAAQVSASVQSQRYARLVENEKAALVDDRLDPDRKDKSDANAGDSSADPWMTLQQAGATTAPRGVAGGVVGGASAFPYSSGGPLNPGSESLTVTAAQAPILDAR